MENTAEEDVTPPFPKSQGEKLTINTERHPAETDQFLQDVQSLYFNDGKRKIDYVLAYSNDENHHRRRIREEFEKSLERCGLELEYEDASKFDNKTCFVKIHAPWDILTCQAEVLKLKMPIKRNYINLRSRVGHFVGDCMDKLMPCALKAMELDKNLVEEPDYYTAVFTCHLQNQFIIKDQSTFFSNAQRSRMVWEMLIRLGSDPDDKKHWGIHNLINHDIYLAAYPLHDSNLQKAKKEVNIKSSQRQILYDTWAKPSTFYKFQPLDLIRNYFGEKIAIYFAWLAFYTKVLVPVAIFGLFCLFHGAASLNSDIPSLEICNETGVGATVMCPNCDSGCGTWSLSESCSYAKVTHLFDNWFTVVFAAVMSIWATLFLEGWKRTQARLTWDWDLTDFEFEDVPRPEFYVAAGNINAPNPITGEVEPYLPFRERVVRIIGSCVAIFFFLLLVLVFVIGVIVYRVIAQYMFYKHSDEFVRSNAQILTTVSAAFLNLICIVFLDWVYQLVARKLTNWEFPRTQTEFDDSYAFKVFLFQFVNCNSSLFYIAFFKGKFATVPNWTEHYIFGYPPEKCNPAGCMVELVIQLAIIMVGKQFINSCLEILFPILMKNWRTWRTETTGTRWEADYNLNSISDTHLLKEFKEMVLQYGFVTLFVSAFPLAPLFALLNNVIEIRLDAYKLVATFRRPMPARVNGLGIWYRLLDLISKLAVLSNAFVIAFTSDFVPRLVYKYVYSIDNTLKGFVQNELSFYDTKSWCAATNRHDICSISSCRYADYRSSPCTLNITDEYCACDPNYNYNVCIKWWHILAVKLAFVLVFSMFIFSIKAVVAFLVPDIPHDVLVQIKRENHVAKQAFYANELASNDGQDDTTTPHDVLTQIKRKNLLAKQAFYNELASNDVQDSDQTQTFSTLNTNKSVENNDVHDTMVILE